MSIPWCRGCGHIQPGDWETCEDCGESLAQLAEERTGYEDPRYRDDNEDK